MIKEKEGAVGYQFQGGSIELRNVAFKHLLTAPPTNKKDANGLLEAAVKKNEYLFKGLNLTIKEGTSNAIVGQSGFGKTTMINMMVSTLL